jgi:hypothetical protein
MSTTRTYPTITPRIAKAITDYTKDTTFSELSRAIKESENFHIGATDLKDYATDADRRLRRSTLKTLNSFFAVKRNHPTMPEHLHTMLNTFPGSMTQLSDRIKEKTNDLISPQCLQKHRKHTNMPVYQRIIDTLMDYFYREPKQPELPFEEQAPEPKSELPKRVTDLAKLLGKDEDELHTLIIDLGIKALTAKLNE